MKGYRRYRASHSNQHIYPLLLPRTLAFPSPFAILLASLGRSRAFWVAYRPQDNPRSTSSEGVPSELVILGLRGIFAPTGLTGLRGISLVIWSLQSVRSSTCVLTRLTSTVVVSCFLVSGLLGAVGPVHYYLICLWCSIFDSTINMGRLTQVSVYINNSAPYACLPIHQQT